MDPKRYCFPLYKNKLFELKNKISNVKKMLILFDFSNF